MELVCTGHSRRTAQAGTATIAPGRLWEAALVAGFWNFLWARRDRNLRGGFVHRHEVPEECADIGAFNQEHKHRAPHNAEHHYAVNDVLDNTGTRNTHLHR